MLQRALFGRNPGSAFVLVADLCRTTSTTASSCSSCGRRLQPLTASSMTRLDRVLVRSAHRKPPQDEVGVYGSLSQRSAGVSATGLTATSTADHDEIHVKKGSYALSTSDILHIVLPSSIRPYAQLMRLDKPIGTWLLFWPGAWSIGLAANPGSLPDLQMLAIFATGAVLLRGAGCVINDMWDQDIDSQVGRTRNRPLASGELTMMDAIAFLAVLMSFGAITLTQLNTYSIMLGGSVIGLITVYPLMKRIVNWPQLFLGLTFNWGALLGWSAVHGACDFGVCLPLYAGCIAWTVVYDTIYAHQDKKFDEAIGVKSTAVHMGTKTKLWLFGFTGAVTTGFVTAGLMSAQEIPYYVAIGLASGHIVRQVWTLDTENAEDCNDKFKSNFLVGIVIMAGIIASSLMKSKKAESSASSPPLLAVVETAASTLAVASATALDPTSKFTDQIQMSPHSSKIIL